MDRVVTDPLTRTDLRRMQRLAQEVWALRPDLVTADATVGELAWVYGLEHSDRDAWHTCLWVEDDQVTAWAWMPFPGPAAHLVWQTHPARPALFDEVLTWFDATAGHLPRRLIPRAADSEARARLAAHGYEPDPVLNHEDNIPWRTQFNRRSLASLEPVPTLPPGYRFRTAADVGPEGAVRAHRDAWEGSRYTEEAYAEVRKTFPYRDDLHVLLEAPDGTLVSSAIIWADAENRTAEFEPVGTHTEYRRRGLGRALLLHGMHLARAAGAETMLVGCTASDRSPAAKGLYYGVGFREFTRDVPYRQADRAAPQA